MSNRLKGQKHYDALIMMHNEYYINYHLFQFLLMRQTRAQRPLSISVPILTTDKLTSR